MSGVFRVLAWLAVIAGAVMAIIYYAYADVWTVPSDDPRQLVSIEPTLKGGDVLLVARHGLPSEGDLVRCVDPDEPRRWVVARLVGVSGSTLELDGQTFSTPGSRPRSDTACETRALTNPANGEEVSLSCRNEEFAGREYQSLTHAGDGADPDSSSHVVVAPGRSFLLSDDRYLHVDSRDYGSVPAASCHRILFRLWGAEGFTDASRRFDIVW
jgi:signal peptidase I